MEEAQLRENHNAALAWFSEFQRDCVIRNGIIPEWFHGIISRKTAEELLLYMPVGHFLIRVSESRIGYTLSHRAQDRCRHFMIDVLKNGQYNVVGESTNHRSLQDLVAFHRRFPILPFSDLLTVGCGQVSKDKADYVGLLFPQREPLDPTPRTVLTNDSHTSNAPQLRTSPTLPQAPLEQYSTLDTELATLALQGPSMTNNVIPVPLPRKKFISVNTAVLHPQPPELPPRSLLPKGKEQTNSGPHQLSASRPVCSERPLTQPNLNYTAPAPNQQKNQGMRSAVVSLMQFKRRSQNKGGAREEHMYTELSEANETARDQLSLTAFEGRVGKETGCENVHQQMVGERPTTEPNTSLVHITGVPEEYLTPPPFAPGY